MTRMARMGRVRRKTDRPHDRVAALVPKLLENEDQNDLHGNSENPRFPFATILCPSALFVSSAVKNSWSEMKCDARTHAPDLAHFALALTISGVRNGDMTLLLRLLLIVAFWVVCGANSQAQNWMDSYNRLLGKYVTSGGVKYAEWKNNAADMQAIQAVVDGIEKENVSGLDKRQQLAFYINAYNGWILHEALEKYPTKSVKDAFFTFFTAKRIKVAGQETSFNALEKETIRSKFSEPRVHFALNCASRSCPPLNREAFSAVKLEEQFE